MQEILNMNIYLGLVSEIDSNIQEILQYKLYCIETQSLPCIILEINLIDLYHMFSELFL